MLFYDYYRSSAAYRVRIALEIKRISVERRFVHLLRGEQRLAAFLEKNPQGLVPALELDDGTVLTQSLAIIDYLETLQPNPRLVPADPVLAARVRAAALAIACDTHPLGNLRVISYLQETLGQSERVALAWRRHWVRSGLDAVEALIRPSPFCFTATPTIADLCLAPQLFYAERFGVTLETYPKIGAVAAACAEHPAFRAAHPAAQPDAAEAAPGP